MPAAKALALYSLANHDQIAVLPPGSILTALRCRNEDNAGSICLMLAASSPHQIVGVLQSLPGVGVRAVVSTSVLADATWRATWLPALGGPVAALIDSDPFQLLEALSKDTIRIGRIGLRSQTPGEPVHIDVLVLHGQAEPDTVYFTPCSSAVMKALLSYGRSHAWPIEETDAHVRSFQDLLVHAASHTVREERCFGFRFWE